MICREEIMEKFFEPFQSQREETRKSRKKAYEEDSRIQNAFTLLDLPDEQASASSISLEATDPLPGFDKEIVCPLCKVKCNRTTLALRENQEGASLVEFLDVAQLMFNQQEGRPALDIAQEIREHLLYYVKQHPKQLKPLSCLTKEDVYRHFKYNHERKTVSKIKDQVLQVLLSMLDVAVTSACCKQATGKLSLCKQEANLLLNIIDRIQKVYVLREESK